MVVKCNAFGQPIGKTAAKVSTEIGIMARDGSKVPLLPCKWPKISQNVKETIWKIILAKFSFQSCTEKTKRWVQAKARDSWKQWKHYLFMEYHIYDRPIEQQYDRVDKDQWRKLVDYWRSENFKKVSAQNKANRAQLKMIHRCGTMSFARKWEEEREKNPDGQEPDRMHMFYVTYTLSNGLFPQPEAARIYAQMEQLTQPTNGEEGMNREDAFTDVMGGDGHGRARMYGVGVTPKLLRNEDCQHHSQMNEVVQRMANESQAKIRELEESHDRTKQELAATKEKLAAAEANLETTNQKVDLLSVDLQAIRAFMTNIQPLMGSATQPSG